MFYVDRRANVVKLNDYQPFSLNKLPAAIAGFERINQSPVEYHPVFRIREDVYSLRSVVCAKTNSVSGEGNLVIGSFTLVKTPSMDHIAYDPYDATKRNNRAVVDVSAADWQENAENKGTVYIYALTTDSSKGEFFA